MSRHVLTLNLKDDPSVIERYRQFHRDVWPEVRQGLRGSGLERMDIYLLGRRLVMVVDVRDGVDCHQALAFHAASSPRAAEWERLMASLQEPVAEARGGEWWAIMEPVFHLEEQELSIAHGADRARAS